MLALFGLIYAIAKVLNKFLENTMLAQHSVVLCDAVHAGVLRRLEGGVVVQEGCDNSVTTVYRCVGSPLAPLSCVAAPPAGSHDHCCHYSPDSHCP
jgi:hypothetical protein